MITKRWLLGSLILLISCIIISKALKHHDGKVKSWPGKLKVDDIENTEEKIEKNLKADEDDEEVDENEIVVPAHHKKKEEDEKEEEEDEDEGDEIEPKNIIDDIKHGASAAAHSISEHMPSFELENFLGMNVTSYLEKMKTAIKESKTKEWVDSVNKKIDIPRVVKEIKHSKISQVTCQACKVLVSLAKTLMKMGKDDESIADTAISICKLIGSHFEAKDPSVCEGMIEGMGMDAIYAMRHADMSASQVCAMYFTDECDNKQHEKHNWLLSVPLKPASLKTKPVSAAPPEDAPKLKVLQLTDIHFDQFYEVGSESDCDFPACCRGSVGYPSKSPETAAGKWGDYRKCDSPQWLIENAFEHIAETHKDIDYILWTGDVPGHDIWNQSRQANVEKFRHISGLIRKYFGNAIVLPTVGNHESFPIDSFVPPSLKQGRDMRFLYDELANEWSRWLGPDSEAIKKVRYGGYYSHQLRPGFRIISVNGNYCGRNNFLLMINSTDPFEQLDWLTKQLEDAERNGEKVHIINHVPPGGPDCVKAWSHNYYNIINRFADIITGQFYGHTHFDEFEVFYDTNDFERPTGVAYIAPSITPWKDCNPAYRIYYVDGDYPKTTRSIIDMETWTMNLDEANKNDKPKWYMSYSARSAYDMKSLLPQDWDDLIQRMSKNRTLFDIYHGNLYRNTPTMPKCDEVCRKDYLCNTRSARSQDKKNLCRNLKVE